MKTSDKILLGTILTILGVTTGTQFALYARYKAGNFLTYADVYRLNHLRQELPRPAHLLIRGINEVHFSGGSRFAIEFEKEGILRRDIIEVQPGVRIKHKEDDQVIIQPRYYRSGDTLVIDGSIPTPEGPGIGVRMLNIFGYTGSSIQLEDGSTFLEGDSLGEGQDYVILMKANSLTLARNAGLADTVRTNNHYHKLTIDARDGSELEFGPGIHIGELNLDLDSTSSLTANKVGWTIDQIHVRPDDRSGLNIEGQLLKKMQGQPAATVK